MKTWQVRHEGRCGNRDFGEQIAPALLGEAEAETFEAAVDAWFAEKPCERNPYRDGNAQTPLMFYGLLLFESEADASKTASSVAYFQQEAEQEEKARQWRLTQP